MDLSKTIEGVLFFRAEPVTKKTLARDLGADDAALEAALGELREALAERGVRLLETDDSVLLVTAPELAELLEKMRREELKRDIGKAGAETLSIVLYRGPATRAEIDFIRGVNSSFILRSLLTRGLIERVANPHDQRAMRYQVTPALLAHLGVTKKTELPDYGPVATEIERFEKAHAQE
jgi:segregation and condensation protein B